MTDRTDALLTQLIELHQRHLALQEASLENQRAALAGQQESLRAQRAVLARQRQWLPVLAGFIIVALAASLLPYFYQWYRYLTYKP